MNILFIICEGPHDAQFIGRLLSESKQYKSYESNLKEYPMPLDTFIMKKYHSQNVDEIRIGKPNYPMVPICAFLNTENNENLVLPVSMGGMDQYQKTIEYVNEIKSDFAYDVLRPQKSSIKKVSILFVYDADSRGVIKTISLFKERFESALKLTGNIINSSWFCSDDFPTSLYIFTGEDKDTGTLEDNIISLFATKNEEWVEATKGHISNNFEHLTPSGDPTAHTAKVNKGILTTCGQIEKSNAGYALTVVVRDTKLLNGAFDFSDQNTQWYKLLNLINGAFV